MATLTVDNAQTCAVAVPEDLRLGIRFRKESAAIRGSSLTEIDRLVQTYRSCGGVVRLENHAEAPATAPEVLRQRRQEEVKYYLMQRRIPLQNILLSETS